MSKLLEIQQQIASIEAQSSRQIAELRRQADEMVAAQRKEVITEVKQKIREFGLTATDLGLGTARKNKSAEPATLYRNAEGQTWGGGRGRKPKWIQNLLDAGHDIEQFRIR